jgi:hypothetical protein
MEYWYTQRKMSNRENTIAHSKEMEAGMYSNAATAIWVVAVCVAYRIVVFVAVTYHCP